MRQRLVIVGAGFAGMFAALSSARLRDLKGAQDEDTEIVLVSPESVLVIRPRLYESHPEALSSPLGGLLSAIGVAFVRGQVEFVDTRARSIEIVNASGGRRTLAYDRLVLATGSRLHRPPIPGLPEHGFCVDQIEDAIKLDQHLWGLSQSPPSEARDTFVVAGAGFTGIEVATEMPARLRKILGQDQKIRIVIVERNASIVPDMGDGPRSVVENALRKLKIETRLGVSVAALEESVVTLSDGERIQSETVIWAAGFRAAPLTGQIPGERDDLGRLVVDRELRVVGVPGVFACGDAAKAPCDDSGNFSLMSCQHATRLGAFAGNNAAAELLATPMRRYHQEEFATCLDLGEAGAVFTRGWDRRVELCGAEAKAYKRLINTLWIYPPQAERAAALGAADPEQVTNL